MFRYIKAQALTPVVYNLVLSGIRYKAAFTSTTQTYQVLSLFICSAKRRSAHFYRCEAKFLPELCKIMSSHKRCSMLGGDWLTPKTTWTTSLDATWVVTELINPLCFAERKRSSFTGSWVQTEMQSSENWNTFVSYPYLTVCTSISSWIFLNW